MTEPIYDDGLDENRHAQDPYDQERSGRRWLIRLMIVVVVLAATGGFAGILVYAYNKGKEVGSTAIPPIISAGPAPHKIRPENPGGMKILNRDKEVYSRMDSNRPPRKSVPKVERLLPRAESPIFLPTVTELKNQQNVDKGPGEIKLPPAPPVVTDIPKLPPIRKSTKDTKTVKTAKPSVVKKPAANKKWPSIDTLTAIAPPNRGTNRVQLGSFRSEKAVRKTWAGYKKRHADLLGGLTLTIQRRNLGPKKGVYYRLQAGPLVNLATAKALCSKFKKRKIGCVIVRK